MEYNGLMNLHSSLNPYSSPIIIPLFWASRMKMFIRSSSSVVEFVFNSLIEKLSLLGVIILLIFSNMLEYIGSVIKLSRYLSLMTVFVDYIDFMAVLMSRMLFSHFQNTLSPNSCIINGTP